MNRIDTQLAAFKSTGRKALVTYIVNADPNPEATLPAMHALVAGGADIIELGVPFSDPMAEGPTIQRGHERALEHGASLTSSMALVAEFRKTDQTTPVVLMGYANPVERMGYEAFARRAAESGVDGLITVDLPPEECAQLTAQLNEQNLRNIFLIAPTTTWPRAQNIVNIASGFIYYVSLNGVTGAGHLDIGAVNQRLDELSAMTELPICVGFGIRDGASAKAIAERADGVVVGSVLVDKMGSMAGAPVAEIAAALTDLIAPIRAALDE